MSSPIPAAILGATGYAGEGVVRLLLAHPGFHIVHAGSDRLAGTALGVAVPALSGETDLVLGADTPEVIAKSGAKIVFLCKKSPEVTAVVPALLAAGTRLIDIGSEFRMRTLGDYAKYYGNDHKCPELLAEAVYGLSEINASAISSARVVGNPGCYATSMLLPLWPLLKAGLIDAAAPIVSVGYSGLSGAGKKYIESNNNLFYAINENLHSYKTVGHQHTAEVDQELSSAAGSPVHVSFVPHLAPITRGILSTISARLVAGVSLEQVRAAWAGAYLGRPFVRVRSKCQQVEVANVAMTNYCDIAAEVDGQTLLITSALDNLVKGASGQAVQNANLMFGLAEDAGLKHRIC